MEHRLASCRKSVGNASGGSPWHPLGMGRPIITNHGKRGDIDVALDRPHVLGEIAEPLGVSEHADQVLRSRCVVGALVRQEEEGLVSSYRTTKGAAKLVLVEDGLLLTYSEEVARIQEGVTVKIKDPAVKLVGSALDHGIHNAAGVAAIFRVDGRGDQVELLDGIGTGNEAGSVQCDIVGVCSVDEIVALVGLAAVHRKSAKAVIGSHDARSQLFQLGE